MQWANDSNGTAAASIWRKKKIHGIKEQKRSTPVNTLLLYRSIDMKSKPLKKKKPWLSKRPWPWHEEMKSWKELTDSGDGRRKRKPLLVGSCRKVTAGIHKMEQTRNIFKVVSWNHRMPASPARRGLIQTSFIRNHRSVNNWKKLPMFFFVFCILGKAPANNSTSSPFLVPS